jgi:hypothetical protein
VLVNIFLPSMAFAEASACGCGPSGRLAWTAGQARLIDSHGQDDGQGSNDKQSSHSSIRLHRKDANLSNAGRQRVFNPRRPRHRHCLSA